MKNLGYILLALWLVATGLIPLLHLDLGRASVVFPLLAVAAGVLILLDGYKGRFAGNIGGLLLGIWLIGTGIDRFTSVSWLGTALSIGAIAAGIALIIKR
jgi:hypothetical protein